MNRIFIPIAYYYLNHFISSLSVAEIDGTQLQLEPATDQRHEERWPVDLKRHDLMID